MSLFLWGQEYSVQIASLDNQHKKLFALVNEMHGAMKSGKGKEILAKVFNELITYTKTHFSAEEQLMTTHRYPGYLMHKNEHDTLTRQVIEMQQKLNDGKAVMSVEVMEFLKNWLSHHILENDKKYSQFFREKGVS